MVQLLVHCLLQGLVLLLLIKIVAALALDDLNHGGRALEVAKHRLRRQQGMLSSHHTYKGSSILLLSRCLGE